MSADGSHAAALRHDFSLEEVRALHDLPLFELVDRARAVHVAHHPDAEVQLCTLLSVKTGGCPEDCAYCPQSSHHETKLKGEAMLKVEDVVQAARRAKEQGATRFCMGAAWREVKDGPAFERVLDMVREVKGMGLEACVTLGMLNPTQAAKLGSTLTITTSTRRASTIARSSRRAPTRTGCRRCATCGRRASPSARVESSAWVRASTIAASS
jgi:biotin synthase-like enzyme